MKKLSDETTTNHSTPRMHQRPDDPAYQLLDNVPVTQQVVWRPNCYICKDREYARMGMPLCKRCCACDALDKRGHIAADNDACDDCGHELCHLCVDLPPEPDICTCATPCCEVDIGIGVMTCGGQHCPTHGVD